MTRRRRLVFAAVALLLGLAVGFVFLDMIIFWIDQRRPDPRLADVARRQRLKTPNIYEDTPGGYRLRRFLDEEITDPISGRLTRFRTNALGHRGPPIGPKAPDEFRILVLGDSVTLSAYTDQSETYPAVLEQLLRTGGRNVRVINAGVAGASLREELLILNETGLIVDPDVVLVGLFLNDATRSRMFIIPEGLARYSAIARRLAQNWSENRAREENREEYERLSGRPYPEAEFAEGAWRTDSAAFERRIAENATDWGGAWFGWAWNEMRPDLDIMRALAREHGFELVVALLPATIQWEAEYLDDRPQRFFRDLMGEMKIEHLDLLPALREAYQRDRRPLAYDHAHLRPAGNRIVADVLAGFVRAYIPGEPAKAATGPSG